GAVSRNLLLLRGSKACLAGMAPSRSRVLRDMSQLPSSMCAHCAFRRSFEMSAPDAARVKERLTRYVAIDSTNPALDNGVGEAAMTDALAADLQAIGARVVRQTVLPGRDNVLGYFGVSPNLPTIVL